MYLEEFKLYKKQTNKKIQKAFMAFTQKSALVSEITTDMVHRVIKEARPKIKFPPFLSQTSEFTTVRAFMYGLMTVKNTAKLNEVQFSAGLTRFGIENPMPVLKKRIALHGNTEDVLSLLKGVQDKWIMTGDT
jgi:hypothetical protein